MIALENSLISDDIFRKKFICDLNACKGGCCVSGDSGASLNKDEVKILDSIYPIVKTYMNKKNASIVEKKGSYVLDSIGNYTTTLISEGAECVFVYYDKNNIAKCTIEKAYYDSKINWKKPISCHLYPILITEYENYEAINYHNWDICKPACDCGKKLNIPVFKFLKEPLIRKYGKAWYKELEKIYNENKFY